MVENEIKYAPGMRIIVRGEEWMVKKVSQCSLWMLKMIFPLRNSEPGRSVCFMLHLQELGRALM